MKVIGITGGTGAGKTTALDVLAGFGVKIIDCDEVYHELLEDNADMKKELIAAYGDILTDGRIDRKKLGRVVFNNAEKLELVNKITHSYVRAEVKRLLREEASGEGYAAAIDAIALFEGGLSEFCDTTVGITAPENLRVERLLKREGISREYALSRIRAQKSDAWFRENCSHIIENNGDIEHFKKECIEYFSKILDE